MRYLCLMMRFFIKQNLKTGKNFTQFLAVFLRFVLSQ